MLIVLLIVLLTLTALLGVSVRNLKLSYLVASKEKEELSSEIKRLISHKEELDPWKKACWAAEKRYSEMDEFNSEVCRDLVEVREELAKVVNQKKSSEVKLGMVSENALAFIQDLPYNFQNMRQLGSPIDYIYFNTDGLEPEIVLVEVKSNKSKESKKQRLIKDAVISGRVYYEVVRIDGSGINIHRAEDK